jgi:ElaB/YqjD/DUF883 family membrane-anchored ribosome-binding protein
MSKIRKYEIITVSFIFVMSLFVLNNIYAQDATQTTNISDGTRTSDSIDSTRTFDDLTEAEKQRLLEKREATKDLDSTEITNVISSDGETIESIRQVSETLDTLRTDAERTEGEIRRKIKDGIDRNIIDIRKRANTPAFELQRSIDERRQRLYESIDNTLENIRVDSAPSLDRLTQEIEDSFDTFEERLRSTSGIEGVEFEDERRTVRNTLLKFRDEIENKRELIRERGGEKVYEDSDDDGVSDYDEIYIYKTDPQRSRTIEGDLTDGEKIRQGINPLSKENERIKYEDPRQDKEAYVSTSYDLESVVVVKEGTKRKVQFVGKAIPNSYITIYIYSTPIIVTVKTDDNGEWSYELDEELDNGEHQLYVATVNNTGKIVARSNPILFTKTAEAASIGIVGVDVETAQAGDFFRDNFILISLLVLIGVVVITLMFVGNRGSAREVITELKNEVDNPKIK